LPLYGEQPWLLSELNLEGIGDMADIPSDTRIFTTPPVTESPKRKGNRGRHPTKERLAEGYVSPIEVRKLAATLDDTQWTTFSVRETERG